MGRLGRGEIRREREKGGVWSFGTEEGGVRPRCLAGVGRVTRQKYLQDKRGSKLWARDLASAALVLTFTLPPRFRSEAKKTKVKKKTNNPQFDEVFYFEVGVSVPQT